MDTSSEFTLEKAVKASDLSTVQKLLRSGQNQQWDLNRVLIDAAYNGDAAMVSLLLDNGAEIQPQAVMGAVRNIRNAQAIFEVYLRHGWDINMRGVIRLGFRATGPTNYPIMSAVVKDEELTKWCIDHGADLTIPHEPSFSPLARAAFEGTIQTVELLLTHGMKIEESNVLHNAVLRKDDLKFPMLQYLLDHGADINGLKNRSNPQAMRRSNPRFGVGTPLHSAVAFADKETVQWLLDRGADKTIEDREGLTAADIARDWEPGEGHADMLDILG